MKGRRKRELEEISGSWMASYGDMITLLLCFFVMLFAMSTLDAQKWKALSESIKESFGAQGETLPSEILEPTEHIAAQVEEQLKEEPPDEMNAKEALKQLQEMKEKIDIYIKEAGLENTILTEIEEVGLIIRMSTDEILFELGSAQLKAKAVSFLDLLSGILNEVANQVWVEGHTDNIPIQPGYVYPSNWELSTARACSVVRYLVEARGLKADRMRAAGYADTRPRMPNDSDEHRYLNRRVEIVIRPLTDIATQEYLEWKAGQPTDEMVREEATPSLEQTRPPRDESQDVNEERVPAAESGGESGVLRDGGKIWERLLDFTVFGEE